MKIIEPCEVIDFIILRIKVTLILTDPGGVQEEAPFLRENQFL